MDAEDHENGRTLRRIIGIFIRTVQLIAHWLLHFIYGGPGEQLPVIDNLILLDSATALAEKIRSKKLTSVEVVQSFINRIKETNKVLNAVVDNRFEEALNEAKKADDIIRNSGKSKEDLQKELPFLGVPFTAKDSIGIKGLSFTGGLYYRKNVVAEEDADVVSLMRKSGAIPIAATNVPELCLWWESYNLIYGRSNNPYNTNHIVGGSSGGEGCILAAAGSPMGIGSDIGGSVRIPAFFNGIFGHKPSTGVGSLKGHYPVPSEEFQRSYLVSGPMSRFATDLKPMLKIIAPKHTDILQLDEKVDIKKLNYFFMEDDGGNPLMTPVEPAIREAIRKIVAYLKRSHNITAQKAKFPGLRYSMDLWFGKMKAKGESQLGRLLANDKGSVNSLWEIMKLPFGMSRHTLPVLAVHLLDQFNMDYGSPKHLHLIDKCDDLKVEFQNLLGDNGVFIYPTHPTAAPYHTEALVRGLNVGYTAVFNVLGFPSTQCPMGLNKEGLPIGIQVVANTNQDRLCLAVAEELERAFGGWVSPSPSI